ncbi:HAD-IIB family hydrolase [Sediminibacillus dalangtanensis]|uniref:HAD-IIB family hydrolase n=1 Tax=Sediminibacillus dalangtanensis TaxID=2729421 RepID=A0ABX7VP99_9BACI|nr:HAD family hydrolase [Sediminibacillus dalangtanensis]QTM98719.1 HAD-IIB family hydrolase [Sediminibacillus dalangtanensis]
MNIVFDLDGTICFKGKPVSENVLQALEQLQEHGHSIIFASARPIRDMLPVLDSRFHTYTMIGGNGSLISERGSLTHKTAFSHHQLEVIKHLIDSQNAAYLVDGEWNYSYTGPADHAILSKVDPGKLAKNIPIEQHPAVVKALILSAVDMNLLARELEKIDVVLHRHSAENVLDISPENIDKRTALLTIGIDDYIAFGNDANDIRMFQGAHHAVMIGHHAELASFASEEIPLDGDFEAVIAERIVQLSTACEGSKV